MSSETIISDEELDKFRNFLHSTQSLAEQVAELSSGMRLRVEELLATGQGYTVADLKRDFAAYHAALYALLQGVG